MSPIGSIGPNALSLPGMNPTGPLSKPTALPDNLTAAPSSPDGFGQMLDNLVSVVDGKQTQATNLTNQVLLGQTSQLHQSVIAMQEATTALSLMVQVRNKLVESYQQLMQMQI